MSVSILDRYTDRLAGLPQESFIGSLIWFSIAGVIDRTDGKKSTIPIRVTRDLLVKWFDELDLNPAFLPPPISRSNAFRAATSDMERTYALPEEGVSANLLMREVLYDTERVVRHVILETRDRRGAKLTYDKVASITFFRGDKNARGTAASGEQYKCRIADGLEQIHLDAIKALLDDLQTRFNDLSTSLQSQAIRAVIRNYVTHLNAIPVKPSGGLYFIHNTRQRHLDSLQELVSRIGQGSTFSQCPLIDTSAQREMLSSAFEDDVEDEVRLLLEDLSEIQDKAKKKNQRTGYVTPHSYAAAMNKWQRIAERSAEYTETLGLRQERAAAALETALTAVVDMQRHLAAPRKK